MFMARVKGDWPWLTTTSCSGREFVKSEWRQVPAGMKDEAERHPALELKEVVAEAEEIEPEVDATTSAREFAERHDIDLFRVSGSGKGGRVTLDDVKAAVEGGE